MKDVITIDGPSGSGKGTVARALAKKLGYRYLDTGALYRAVAWKVKDTKTNPDSEDELKKIMAGINIDFDDEKIRVDGADISAEIRTAEIGELSSRISAMPVIRSGLFMLQRNMCLKGKVVIEGRDTGTAIFPESENKFYIDAAVDERARRRYEELKLRDPGITMEQTIEDINKRDNRDSSRASSPLKMTDDMSYINTTDLSIEDVVAKIMDNLK
jgi:cytidylate kinase